MNWKEVNKMPTETYGWFAVATLPRNHSGSGENDNTDLAGDNSWRKSFGFTKAWLNNGEWYEADSTGYRSNNITRFVTHWDYLPEVPILTESFKHPANWRLNERPNKEQMRELAMKELETDQKTNPNPVNPDAYSYGFIAALRFIGLR
jgi:hypothetical protein